MSAIFRNSCINNGRSENLVGLVRSGPVQTVCPNFYVLAHATGCRFAPQCAYCYLRDRSQYPPAHGACRENERLLDEARQWLACDDLDNYVLNAGNLSDSLFFEDTSPVMADLVELFRAEGEAKGRPHTLLLVTKGGQAHAANLLKVAPCRNVIVSFSVNCPAAAAKYEAGAATPADRLAAAARLQELGWRVRIRIDPMILGYDYAELVEQVRRLAPERVTLGCLRADGRLMEFVAAGTLDGLVPPQHPMGIWQYPRESRLSLYRPAVEALRATCSVGLCEEWPEIWDDLGLPKETRCCNCNHV